MKRALKDVSFFLFSVMMLVISFMIPFLHADPRSPLPKSPDEIWQNDKDLNDLIKANYGALPNRTLTQIKATIPLKKGQQYFCTDCVNALVCVSTGTSVYGFASMQAANRTTVCN